MIIKKINFKDLKKKINLEFIYFLIIGGSGVTLNLLTLFILTEFIFSKEHYYYGYYLGFIINLIYNFYFYRKLFKKKNKIILNFIIFFGYTLIYFFILTLFVKSLIKYFGTEYYFFIIGSLILFFSIINYFLFKKIIFKKIN